MIHDIRGAFNELLEENEWMDSETRYEVIPQKNLVTKPLDCTSHADWLPRTKLTA